MTPVRLPWLKGVAQASAPASRQRAARLPSVRRPSIAGLTSWRKSWQENDGWLEHALKKHSMRNHWTLGPPELADCRSGRSAAWPVMAPARSASTACSAFLAAPSAL